MLTVIGILGLGLFVRAADPGAPVGHWPMEEGDLQRVYNRVNHDTYLAYLGTTLAAEADRDPDWVIGLAGSAHGLQFSAKKDCLTIENLAPDVNGDRVADSGPLSGSFSMFFRVSLPNTNNMSLVDTDQYGGKRGVWFDTATSILDGSIWRLGLRLIAKSPTNDSTISVNGAAGGIAVTNVETIGISFLADATPGDGSSDGIVRFYVNGEPFGGALPHKMPYVGVGPGFRLGYGWTATDTIKGQVFDDVAIWDRALTVEEMAFVHANGLSQSSGNPGIPYAHYPFEEGAGQIVKNIIAPNVNGAYLGTSAGNTSDDPAWVAGLNGSGYALQYDNRDILSIQDIANDADNDRVADSGPLAGSFSLYMRVQIPNTNRVVFVMADNLGNPAMRGFYIDLYNTILDGNGQWRFGCRWPFFSPTNNIMTGVTGSEATPPTTTIDALLFTFLADPQPGDAIEVGSVAIYASTNGVPMLLNAVLQHNCPY
ncbi:MAG: hypothetical protein PHR35_19440, partial [Kiritimatiellae bacterium]|nr:hypothetical protein [Kiritimatiellia bacterium]